MKKVGIKDIAAAAGVSIATVSNALRNPGRVSAVTHKKVLAAAERIGYTPNHLAASLRTARSGHIVVIIPDVSDSFNSGIIGAIEKVAHSRGYSVLLGDTQGSAEREREFAAMTRSRQADGIILMSHRLPFDLTTPGRSRRQRPPKRLSAAMRERLPPLVNGCEFTGIDDLPFVGIDDVAAGFDATTHLLELGHREIAVITGNTDSSSSRDRLRGFNAALSAAGRTANERWVLFSEYSLQGGVRAAEQLLQRKRRPTAVFCFSDEIAIGCIHTLRRNGFDVPGDISIIGIDDIPFARYAAPPLTTIAQPVGDIGATCAMLLLDLIEGQPIPQLRHILPHTLRVRESTASPR
jgi:LacI family repressor for deo operon, udp, cdd, tsx, nupC, and nupG